MESIQKENISFNGLETDWLLEQNVWFYARFVQCKCV